MKPRYRVDLAEQMATCDANFLRLIKLMPKFEGRSHWLYTLDASGESRLEISVVERAPYTTTVEVSHWGAIPWKGDRPKVTVRLYHDADMAEVIAWQRHRRLQPKYNYPNRQMFHSDEKAQMNLFLGEWLSYCLNNGHVDTDVLSMVMN